jgi:hypothetical protein
MKNDFPNIVFRERTELFSLAMLVMLFLCRTTMPVLKYLFVVLYFVFLMYSLFFLKNNFNKLIKEFIHNYYLVLILIFFFLLSAIFSDKYYLTVSKDFINMLILLSLIALMGLFISGKQSFSYFCFSFFKLILVFAIVVSVLNLLDLYNILTFRGYFPKSEFLSNSFSDILNIDPNFALIPIFFGMIVVFFYLSLPTNLNRKVYLNVILLIFLHQILLSGSRRGLIILAAMTVILLIIVIISYTKKFVYLRLLGQNAGIFIIEFILLVLLSYIFFFQTSYQFKNNTLNILKVKNTTLLKSNISLRILRYVSVFNKSVSYYDLNKKIWSVKFDPRDPDSGWGKGNYSKIFPLYGENVEIVPNDTFGYLLDSTCTGEDSGISYYSATIIGNSNVDFNEIQEASVYSYVSQDFNGDLVSILSEGNTTGNKENKYDLEKKGTWQKLLISVNCQKGDASVYLILSKFGVSDFKLLKGYVIFAYPDYNIISKNAKHTTYENGDFKMLIYNNPALSENQIKIKLSFTENLVNDNLVAGNNSYKLYRDGQVLKTKLNYYSSSFSRVYQAGVLDLSYIFQNQENNSRIDKDPIRRWISKVVSEDTTYNACKISFNLDTISNRFIDLRIVRWKFAWQIFTKEYSLNKKIIGGGFNFLNWYGYYFFNDKTRSDYPHNPFLYILLYSGILGLSIYIIFLFKVFYYYLKYVRIYPLFFVFFIITFYFSFFSSGCPFDPPIMGFFVILPFFIHSIHKKERTLTESTLMKDIEAKELKNGGM